MKRLTKITVSLFMIMLSALVLVACGNNDADLVAKAKEALTISYQSGDSATSVTKDITLKTKEGEVTVAWASNDAAIDANGKVIRPTDANKPVELTATLSKGSAKDTKKFNVTVIAEVAVDPNVALVAAAKEALAIGFATGDTKDSVTQNLTLVAKQGDVAVVWTSNKAAIVSTAGVVTRPADANQPVELTATLSKGDARDTKVFTVTVKKAEAPVEYDKALLAYYKDTLDNPEFKLTENFELIAEIEGKTITWAVTNNGEYFNIQGEVTRPSYTKGDVTVTIVGTVEGKKATFFVLVAKLDQTVEEKIQAALDKVTVVPSSTTGYQETNFLTVEKTQIDSTDVDVTWTTSDAETMTAKGELVVFTGDEREVVLTASITFGGVTLTKNITFKVKAIEEFDNLKTALTTANFEVVSGKVVGKKILVKNVAFYKDITDGYYVSSAENMLGFVYGNRNKEVLKENKLYDMIATIDVYYGTFQLKDVSFSNEHDGVMPVIEAVEMTLDQIVSLPKPTNDTPNQHTLYKLVGTKVRVVDKNNLYKTFFVDKDLESTVTLNDKNSIMVYYKSDLDVIKTLNNIGINAIEVINNGYRTNNDVWNVNFIGTVDDIDLNLTNQEAVDAIYTQWDAAINKHYYKNADLKFETSGLGATIEWSSTNEAAISTKGVITVPTPGITVTLTAVITKGEATKTLTKEVKVAALELSTVAEALAGQKGDYFKVTGAVTANSANGTYTFQDATGAIAIYASKGVTLDVGFLYTITGSRNTYNGLNQIEQLEPAQKGQSAQPVDAVVITDEMIVAGLEEYQNRLITINNAIITKAELDSNKNVVITLQVGSSTITLKWDTRVTISAEAKAYIEAFKDGDEVNIVAAPLGWNKGALIGFDNVSQIILANLTDEQKAQKALDALELEDEYTQEFALPTAGSYGASITWVANPATSLVDGKLVIPTEGEVEVTLTATITVGEVTKTKEFTVKLEASAATGKSYTFDFGTVAVTGYDGATLKFKNTDGVEYTLNKSRAQTNTSTYAPHTDGAAVLVLAPASGKGTDSYIEFDFTAADYTKLTSISFNFAAWNQSNVDKTKGLAGSEFILQKYNETTKLWEKIDTNDGKSNLIASLEKDVYVSATFDVTGAGKYRISYSAPKGTSGNTDQAIVVDNVKINY